MNDLIFQALVAFWISITEPSKVPDVMAHARAIARQSNEEVTALKLVSMAYGESHFDETAVSYLLCPYPGSPKKECARKRVRLRSRTLNPKWYKGSMFCGPVQTTPTSWAHCVQMTHDLDEGYKQAVQQLQNWIRAAKKNKFCKKLRGDAFMACALRGYGGGWKLMPKTKHSYAWNILKREKWIIKQTRN